ncbi:ATP-dependent Clp protease proteolytic subunit [Elizabethkingia anophelis]|uniref:ATP-dependent Clp protease proteolytic subunit n=1 Tax=Elizabethkingia anophelis TaxID=1117645 RepID=UPI00320AF6EE
MKRKNFKIEAFNNLKTQIVNIKITDRIGNSGTDATSMQSIVEAALAGGIKKATLFISSGGGSTLDTQDMILALKKLDFVSITVGAVAASAATHFLTEFPAEAYPESQFMIHKPSMGTYGNVDQIKADIKLLENTQEIYRKAYAKSFKKTEAEIEELWKNDYWMSAEEALQLGLIQGIIVEEIPWDDEAINTLSACGAPNIPNKPTQESKPKIMDRNRIIAAAGLAADATDEQIFSAIQANKTKAGVSDELKTKLEAAQKKKVEDLVSAAITDKKITADQKESYEKLATADYDSTEAVIKSLPKIEAVSKDINTPSTAPDGKIPEDRKNWTYEDYLENDPKAYEELLAKDQKGAMAIFNNRRKTT